MPILHHISECALGHGCEQIDCRYVNIVPTSAITGEGIPDMLQLLVKLTQARSSPAFVHPSDVLLATICPLQILWDIATPLQC